MVTKSLIHLLGLCFAIGFASSAYSESKTDAEKPEIIPDLTYRLAALSVRSRSVFHKDEHKNFVDQLYLTLRLKRSSEFKHLIVLEPTIRTMRNNPAGDLELLLDQAFIQTSLADHIQVAVGKKTEYRGSGFFVNPSDLLNEQKDLFDPLYQREGQIFSRIAWVADGLNLGLGFIPKRGQNAKEGKIWLVADATVAETQVSFQEMYNEEQKSTTGLSLARFFGDHFELHWDGRYQSRQRAQTWSSERQFAQSYQAEDPSGFFAAGTRIVFTPQRTVVLEAIQNQSGLNKSEGEQYFASIAATPPDKTKEEPVSHIIGRHYAFVGYQDEETVPHTRLSLSFLRNTDDGSSFLVPSLRHEISQVTSVEFSPTYCTGTQGTEFGEMPFWSVYYLTFRGTF